MNKGEIMQEYRRIISVDPGEILERGGKTRVTRFIDEPAVNQCAPFLLIEVLELDAPDAVEHGFPWRPYDGIECITCFLALDRKHHDAGKDDSPAWVCASNGEISEEVPADLSGASIGVQVWAWLPEGAGAGNVERPGFLKLPAVSPAENASIEVIAGKFGDTDGALTATSSNLTMLDIYIAPHAEYAVELDPANPALAYVLEGEGYFEQNKDEVYPEGRVIAFSSGEKLAAAATHRGVRILLLSAPQPDGTPILNERAIKKSEDNWVKIAYEERR